MTIVIVRPVNALNTGASYRRLLPLSLWRLATSKAARFRLRFKSATASWASVTCGFAAFSGREVPTASHIPLLTPVRSDDLTIFAGQTRGVA